MSKFEAKLWPCFNMTTDMYQASGSQASEVLSKIAHKVEILEAVAEEVDDWFEFTVNLHYADSAEWVGTLYSSRYKG